ncbi:hypothetical protein GFY24_22165 [Nocardia sp. SYP-A9097]|uniref:hypothetical protein n=1 Tax=Nocardia sp. SYP-A9097 TaxID=2663237 RepID=UPI00129A1357|nr:hypothetical protein [Nocardia sp. SYP-A9097]MRH90114.1 hypothetical protein [Nocardia sp. SYP-A9097]
MRKIAATSALLIGTAVIGCGTATAAPAPVAPVNYTAKTLDNAAVISTDSGSLVVENGALKIEAADGTVLAGTELSFRVDDFVFPVTADIAGRTATLTPLFDTAHAEYKPVALPFEDSAPWRTPYEREVAAWGRLTSTITAGAAIGTTIGGIGGGAIGCILGGVAAGGGATLATGIIGGIFSFLPAAAVGCIAGAAAMAAIGTLAGALLVTGPVALAAAAQYFTTINSPLPGK